MRPRIPDYYTPMQPMTPDPGALDYLYTTAYDTLYHSPVSSLWRAGELSIAERWGDGPELTAEEASSRYGLGGELRFTSPINEEAAKIMYDRKVAELERATILAGGWEHGGFFRKAGGMGTGLVAGVADPINLAASFIPVVGQASTVNRLRMAGASASRIRLAQGLITDEGLTRILGTGIIRRRAATGAIEGTVGTALVEPLVLIPAWQEQAEYGWQDSLLNVVAGGVIGPGLHIGFGRINDWWKSRGLDTQEAATRGAIADILEDRPVRAPDKTASVDPRSILDELASDTPLPTVQSHMLDVAGIRASMLGDTQVVASDRLTMSRETFESGDFDTSDYVVVSERDGQVELVTKKAYDEASTRKISEKLGITRPARFHDIQKIVDADRMRAADADEVAETLLTSLLDPATTEQQAFELSRLYQETEANKLLPWTMDLEQADLSRFLYYPEMRARLEEAGFDGYIGFGERLGAGEVGTTPTIALPFKQLARDVDNIVKDTQTARAKEIMKRDASAHEKRMNQSPPAQIERVEALSAVPREQLGAYTAKLTAEADELQASLGDLTEAELASIDALEQNLLLMDMKAQKKISMSKLQKGLDRGIDCMTRKMQ